MVLLLKVGFYEAKHVCGAFAQSRGLGFGDAFGWLDGIFGALWFAGFLGDFEVLAARLWPGTAVFGLLFFILGFEAENGRNGNSRMGFLVAH